MTAAARREEIVRTFASLPPPGGMHESELARLIGVDRIETLDAGEGYSRCRVPLTEGAKAGFEAVFSGTFACYVDWVATQVVAAGKEPAEALDLLARVRTKSITVEILANTNGRYVDLETRIDGARRNDVFVTTTITDDAGELLVVGKARLGYVRKE